VCVCDKIDWMENGWMNWIEWMWKVDGCGKWMWKVESAKWKVEGGAVPDLTLLLLLLYYYYYYYS